MPSISKTTKRRVKRLELTASANSGRFCHVDTFNLIKVTDTTAKPHPSGRGFRVRQHIERTERGQIHPVSALDHDFRENDPDSRGSR